MKRNCNLELRLVPPSPLDLRPENHSDGINLAAGDVKEKQNQQLTIFYNGKVSVCDVTELQARMIIKLASEEMDDKWGRTPGSTSTTTTTITTSSSSSPLMSTGVSMKRSLQRFLQKRKHRMQAANSPYHP